MPSPLPPTRGNSSKSGSASPAGQGGSRSGKSKTKILEEKKKKKKKNASRRHPKSIFAETALSIHGEIESHYCPKAPANQAGQQSTAFLPKESHTKRGQLPKPNNKLSIKELRINIPKYRDTGWQKIPRNRDFTACSAVLLLHRSF